MTSNELWTLGIAAYAAVISTFVLGWDAYKWLDSGPKLLVTALTGMKMVGGTIEDSKKTFVMVTAVNRGDRPTTITNLGLLYYKSRVLSVIHKNKPLRAFVIPSPSDSQVIPYKFDPGGQWVGLMPQDEEITQMIREGCLFAVVYHSHSGKGVRVRLTANEIKASETPKIS
jgi:hypothetical protein